MTYVERFEKLGVGMFVHFGLYSVRGKGEWNQNYLQKEEYPAYHALKDKFRISKNWAKELVKTAKAAGCKYITLTTRHHDGFSLFDTCGLNDFDAPHSACKRDLIREFVDECNKGGIVPFFYHTLLDWYQETFETDFPKYIDYLIASVELLCKNYGKIVGLWFDGMWSKPNEDWQEDRLYATIRKYQPEAMIINNTGLSELGKVGHPELDSVTFERGAPCFVDNSDRRRAGEMCQVLNDHWGYAENDYNYKPVSQIVSDLVDCRKYNCNFLLNIGLKGNGLVRDIDGCFLRFVGKWIRANKNFIYGVRSADITAENADILKGDDGYYAVIKNVPMSADPNVQRSLSTGQVCVHANLERAVWLDSGEEIPVENNSFAVKPFLYGESRMVRVAKLYLKA